MKEISLTQGKVALIDDEDYADLSQFKWYVLKDKYTFYAVRSIHCHGKQTTEYMARRILNVQPGEDVDHKNHNGLDNRKENIRICTQSQNGGNRKKNINSSSRFKGLDWHNEKWRARIRYKGKQIHLGYFVSDEDAARIYDATARRYFGEFALINFPQE